MRLFIVGLALIAVAGCGRPARTRDEIFAERLNLPQLYVGLKTQKQIVAPATKGVFVDPDTKDEFWPAMECVNPDCPKRQGSEPVLFVLSRTEPQRGCPSCLKRRDPKSETREQKDRYESFVRPFVLPETKARLDELDAELKRATK